MGGEDQGAEVSLTAFGVQGDTVVASGNFTAGLVPEEGALGTPAAAAIEGDFQATIMPALEEEGRGRRLSRRASAPRRGAEGQVARTRALSEPPAGSRPDSVTSSRALDGSGSIFLTKPVDVGLERVGGDARVVAPHLDARARRARPPRRPGRGRGTSGCWSSFSVSRTFLSSSVIEHLHRGAEGVGAELEHGVLGLLVRPELGADARQEHGELEGLGHVVVGPRVEAEDGVGVRVPGPSASGSGT